MGSAHDEVELAVLVQVAKERLHAGQQVLDLGLDADRTPAAPAGVMMAGQAVVTGTASQVLWQALSEAYARLGFDVLGDEAFAAMVLARCVEPASKLATIEILNELGVRAPHRNTLSAALKRATTRDYRDTLAKAAREHSVRTTGTSALILYDVTTLHFENTDEDDLRRVGMSKEHRVDPRVQVGLLVDPGGFPLEMHVFEGNKAETTTLIPVLSAFQARHEITDMVVVADAGMLSAANLNALEDAGFSFVVGSRITKAPYDLAEHFERHGDYLADGQILESSRAMGTSKAARTRRVIYQYKFARYQQDNRAINAMVTRAEKITTGATAMAKARFVKVTGATKELDQGLIDRARQLAGLKGYVTNLAATTMDGQGVIDAYHDLYQVERSFRMAKGDLRARPVFHHDRDAIEAHLTCESCGGWSGRRPRATGPNRRQPQEARPDPAAPAHRDDRHRRPHDHRQAPPDRRRRADPRQAAARHRVTNVARVRPDGRPGPGRDLHRGLRERHLRAEVFGADPPPLASDDLHRPGDRDITNTLAGALMDAGRDHPTRRAPRRFGRDDQHPPAAAGGVDRVGHAVSGQVEKGARSITLQDRRLDHDSWSLSWWMSSQHPSQPKATSPSVTGPGRHLHAQPRRALEQAKTALKPAPAKVLATELDPDAQRARPHLARRNLQMVLQLLALNAEAWLAEHFNAYLADPNEYRAILRNLLHLGGTIDYTPRQITVTLGRREGPRVACALQLLTEELNATPARLPGDRRHRTYQLADA